MNRQLSDHWDLILGETKLVDINRRTYALVVGYAKLDKKLYFRLYDSNSGYLLRGTYLTTLYEEYADMRGIPIDLIEDIKIQVKRFFNLKAFA
jgi:hypothetical protein